MLLSVFPNQRGWTRAGCGPGLVGPRRVGPHEALDQMRATEPLLALVDRGLGQLSARDWDLPPFSQSLASVMSKVSTSIGDTTRNRENVGVVRDWMRPGEGRARCGLGRPWRMASET